MRAARVVPLVLLALAAGHSATAGQPMPPPQPAAAKSTKPAPMVFMDRSRPAPASVFGDRAIDISPAAKAAGHNGSVEWRVFVDATGKPVRAELRRSSHSEEIDAAGRAQVDKLRYSPAVDAALKDTDGFVDVNFDYSLWDDETPGGGLDQYRCGDLVREAEWFRRANEGREKVIFGLENFYVSRDMMAWRETHAVGWEAAAKQRAVFMKDWRRVLADCRKHPTALLLDRIKDPADFKRWVESF